MRKRITLLAIVLFSLPVFAQEPPAGESPAAAPTPAQMREKAEAAQAALAESREKGAVLLGHTIEEKDLAAWREALSRRIDDLKRLEAVLQERGRIERIDLETGETLENAKKELAKVTGPEQKPIRLPGSPNREHLAEGQAERDRLKTELDAAERRLADRKESFAQLEERLAAFPVEKAELSRLVKDAEVEAPEGLDAYRVENQKIRLQYLQAWLAFAPINRPILDRRRELAAAELKIAQANYERQLDYLARLGAVTAKNDALQRDLLREDADAKKAEAEAATDPELKRKAERDEEILRLRSDWHGDHVFLESRDRDIRSEEAVNKGLRDDLAWMKERFQEDRGVSPKTADLLRNLLRRTQGIAAGLRTKGRPDLTDWQEDYGSYRADVSDRLREVSRENDEELKGALEERAASIYEVVSRLRSLDTLYLERQELIDDLQPLVINRIYRVRSDKPLDGKTFSGVKEEAEKLATLYTGSPLRDGLVDAYRQGKWRFVVFALGFLLLLVLGVWLIRKVGHYRTRWNYRGGALLVALQRMAATLVMSALAPLCLVLAAQLLGLLKVPPEIEVPGKEFLYGVAGVLFVHRFLWGLFHAEGVAVTEFGAPPAVAEQMLRASRWATLGLFCLALPWWIVIRLPLTPALEHLPRVLYTLMILGFAVLLMGLLRRGGALVASLTGSSGFWYQAWFFLWPLFCLGLLAIVAMDVLGYRYGAESLIGTVAQTLLAFFLIVGLYNLIQVIIDKASKKVRRQLVEELGRSEARAEATEALNQVTRLASVAIVVVTLLLLAGFWGVTGTLKSLLSAVEIAEVDKAAGLSVTLWDALGALLWIIGAHFLIAHLPGLYRFVLFPRLGRLDTGTRFVILAVSRYLILLVAYSAAILTLHISFSSLGYIFAALSVGIGFGLQEIVSNFISGLILFFERPVRVGDLVSVGNVLGTVHKISIRATEVVNLDRQVIIIPNRQFITEQVTNWTHNDEYVRLTIDVGVSYSEDVGQVARILSEILEQNPKVLGHPPARVVFNGFGDSSLNFWVRPFTTIDDRVDVLNEINAEIMRRFREEGIEIPFPQRDLHVRSVDRGVQFTVSSDERPVADGEPSTEEPRGHPEEGRRAEEDRQDGKD